MRASGRPLARSFAVLGRTVTSPNTRPAGEGEPGRPALARLENRGDWSDTRVVEIDAHVRLFPRRTSGLPDARSLAECAVEAGAYIGISTVSIT